MERKEFLINPVSKRIIGSSFSIAFLFFVLTIAYPVHARRDGIYHTVTKGVTLYRISQAYKIPLAKLMEVNGLSSPSALRVGQELFIPGAKAVLKVEPYVSLTALEKKDLERSLETEEKSLPPNHLRKQAWGQRAENLPGRGRNWT